MRIKRRRFFDGVVYQVLEGSTLALMRERGTYHQSQHIKLYHILEAVVLEGILNVLAKMFGQ